jgi:hypothetical protein
MYEVDDLDEVIPLVEPKRPAAGAPDPFVAANETTVVLGYLPTSSATEDPPYALVRFDRVHAHYLGAPNDEAFEGHPLAKRGLSAYGAYEVRNSSWIRSLERMNQVHPRHDAAAFRLLRHFVVCFHDSTFECVARRFDVLPASPHRSALEAISEALDLVTTH